MSTHAGGLLHPSKAQWGESDDAIKFIPIAGSCGDRLAVMSARLTCMPPKVIKWPQDDRTVETKAGRILTTPEHWRHGS
jgi:hypothetical protein